MVPEVTNEVVQRCAPSLDFARRMWLWPEPSPRSFQIAHRVLPIAYDARFIWSNAKAHRRRTGNAPWHQRALREMEANDLWELSRANWPSDEIGETNRARCRRDGWATVEELNCVRSRRLHRRRDGEAGRVRRILHGQRLDFQA